MASLTQRSSLIAESVKNMPAMQETWVQFLGQEDPLEKGMATHSSILAWRIPWTEKPGRLYSLWGHKESDTTERLSFRRYKPKCLGEKCTESNLLSSGSTKKQILEIDTHIFMWFNFLYD